MIFNVPAFLNGEEIQTAHVIKTLFLNNQQGRTGKSCFNGGWRGTYDCLTGNCICALGWKGDLCDCQTTCPRNCSGKGQCQCNGECVCDVGFSGVDCSNPDKKSSPTSMVSFNNDRYYFRIL